MTVSYVCSVRVVCVCNVLTCVWCDYGHSELYCMDCMRACTNILQLTGGGLGGTADGRS